MERAMDEWVLHRNHSLGLNDCEEMCKNNRSCKAYASAESDGTGCKFSYGQVLGETHKHVAESESIFIRNSTLSEKNGATTTQKPRDSGTDTTRSPLAVPKTKNCMQQDILTPGNMMNDSDFLESPNKMFKLKFFNLDHSSKWYLGVEFVEFKKIFWVANRENPLSHPVPDYLFLKINKDGDLVICNQYGISNTINFDSPATGSTTHAKLLDSGNFVLKAGERIVWQSFDYPTDVLLPGMKLGLFNFNNVGKPQKHLLTSWLSLEVPASGVFTLGIDPRDTHQLSIWQRGKLYWQSGEWSGHQFSYFPGMGEALQFNFNYTSDGTVSYYTFDVTGDYKILWIQLDSCGKITMFQGLDGGWSYWWPTICDVRENNKACISQKPDKCSSRDEFLETKGQYMEKWEYHRNHSMGLNDCAEMCKNNCSCKAYASAESDGTGCKFSYGQVLGEIIKHVADAEPIFIRNSTLSEKSSTSTTTTRDNDTDTTRSPSEVIETNNGIKDGCNAHKKQMLVSIIVPLVSMAVFALLCSLCCFLWKKSCFGVSKRGSRHEDASVRTEVLIHELGISMAAIKHTGTDKLKLNGKLDHELPLFSFSSIETSTGYFSNANKLGQGGFGPVYKGTLSDGQEIAVKRLSKRSGQGVQEFENEMMLISNLQHKNLVRVLGCCIKGEEKIIVYEYLPNKSLDSFIFDTTKRVLLDWEKRLRIIEGIAQGLLYLHKYSRLRIIHRDLKNSNILLDSNMNPIISDFGTAKIFGDNESGANTNRIVGTYGYMSPEYAMTGLFSEKSDVFSFGVMVLEILSGKKNTGFHQPNEFLNLLEFAWSLWKEGKFLELMDPVVSETCKQAGEFSRCVQVALLCVQENAADRPIMSEVVSMLGGGDMVTPPAPKQPAFLKVAKIDDNNLLKIPGTCSVNHLSISIVQAR
ncbi:G-type lectin S-receptor-like serine/threonine-protein kinase At1g67520 [Ziziphus jujuba]|uniref:G-type lectin S-receptor-like serine/threonine-protein kinase At1g67520 n=1 Tax=Ziziphus jujuba TaxID=326968 RepID=A0ABM4ADS1_ZIZJJ|nr:G-type lectin S-receptor-like serine/threonine-protein kinase At1g67520 [Ziziphus jujuba]